MIIFNHAMKRILQNKTRLIILLMMPLVFIAMFAMQDERSLTIGVVDKDASRLSVKLADKLKNIYKVEVKLIDERTVYDKAVSYQTDYTIIIEKGFEENLIAGRNVDVKEFYLNDKEKLFYAKNLIENYIRDMKMIATGVGNEKVKFSKTYTEYSKGKLLLKNEIKEGSKLPKTERAMGFLIQFMLYMSVVTAGIISEDRSRGTFYRVFYAPVTLKRYICENLLAFLTIGVAQIAIILGLIKIVFGMSLGASPVSLFILLGVFSMVCVSLGMWLISMFKRPIGVYTTIVLITTPLVMLGGCYWPKNYMPEIFQKISLFIPTSWVMEGAHKILFENKNVMGISYELLVLVIFSGIFLAAGLFKKVDISK